MDKRDLDDKRKGQDRCHNHARGTGREINANNVNLRFKFDYPLKKITLKFAELGGNNNMMVNGDFRNVGNLVSLNGLTVGGVTVTVTATAVGGNSYGIIVLDGAIKEFSHRGPGTLARRHLPDEVTRSPGRPEGCGRVRLARAHSERRQAMKEINRILVVSRMTRHCRKAVRFGVSLARQIRRRPFRAARRREPLQEGMESAHDRLRGAIPQGDGKDQSGARRDRQPGTGEGNDDPRGRSRRASRKRRS